MRFFSNDARESAEDQNPDDRSPEQRAQDEQALNEQALNDRDTTDRDTTDQDAGDRDADGQPDRIQSEPVAVPSQRAGSPWSDTPADNAADAGTDRRDDVTGPDAGRDDTDQPPTAFGTSSVAGPDATVDPADRAPADDDGVVTSSSNTYAGSTADSAPDTVPATWTEQEKRDNDPDEIVDVPLDDQPAAVTDRPGDHDSDRDSNHDDAVTTYADDAKTDTLKDEGTFDDPKAVDPDTEQPLDSTVSTVDDSADSDTDDSAPIVAPAPVVAAPAVATAAAGTTLFDKDDASSFQERWRDVQLRFVDSPKEAAGDAAKLVEEAVEKVTAALRSQREGLHADTDDTEQLRVQLRGYRDMLNRIIGL